MRARTIGLAGAAVLGILITVSGQAQERRTLATKQTQHAGTSAAGRLPATQRMDVTLTLQLRNEAQLSGLLQRLYDPTSPDYRHFLTVEEFTREFGPTEADYSMAVAFAREHGLTVGVTPSNRLIIEANGTVADIENAFSVKMQTYRHPTQNRMYYAPDVEPSVATGVPIAAVAGLNTYEPPRPASLYRPESAAVMSASTGSHGGQFLGSDIRAAYAPGVTLDGSGQAVGIFSFGPYNLSDVQNYFSTIGQPLNVPIHNVLLNGVSGVCSGCDDGEQVIDIEQAVSMAPNLAAVYFYEGNSDVSILNRMATDNLAKQLSSSWLWLPADPSSDEPIFKEFAAQGQNFFQASGDSGAYSPAGCTSNCVASWYPADDPFITSVGGTDLNTNGAGGTWQSESTWVGSGGGRGTNGFGLPSYQSGIANASNQASGSVRNVPDVAAEANTDNYFCANGTCQGGVGGTSLAAPRWAGFLALANEQAAGAAIGFLNPTLYNIGRSSSYGADFHDITNGSNANGESSGLYSAVGGYDLATGWGSPQGQSMINALSGNSPRVLNGARTLAPQSATGMRLDDWLSGTGSGNQIDIWIANNTGAQSWVFSNTSVVPGGFYNLAVSYGPFCVQSTGTTSGSVVNLQPCNGSLGQAWNAAPAGSTYVLHPANNTGLCLDTQGGSSVQGTSVAANTCNGSASQSWSIN